MRMDVGGVSLATEPTVYMEGAGFMYVQVHVCGCGFSSLRQ